MQFKDLRNAKLTSNKVPGFMFVWRDISGGYWGELTGEAGKNKTMYAIDETVVAQYNGAHHE